VTGLFDPGDAARWTGSTELVVVDRDRCPGCAGPLVEWGMVEAPLFRHGGHGAARETLVWLCVPCGWSGRSQVTEVRP
jgi:hypothetical protein